MLYSASALRGSNVCATGGEPVGRLLDAYASVETGGVRLLVIEGSSGGGKIVLLPADSIEEYDFAEGRVRLKENPDQVQSAQEAAPGVPMTMPDPADENAGHMHLVSQVLGYGVEAVNGPLGRVGDVLIDAEGLAARYIIIDTREWQPGSDKLVPTEWIDLIDWTRGRVFLKITREKARMCQRASAGSHVF